MTRVWTNAKKETMKALKTAKAIEPVPADAFIEGFCRIREATDRKWPLETFVIFRLPLDWRMRLTKTIELYLYNNCPVKYLTRTVVSRMYSYSAKYQDSYNLNNITFGYICGTLKQWAAQQHHDIIVEDK